MPDIVMVRSFEVRKTRNQDSFGSLRLSLGRGGDFAEVDAKIWGLDGYIKGGNTPPAAGDLLEIQYKADDYQGRPQWIIQGFRILAGAERERAFESFTPQTRIDRAFYRQRLDDLIERTSAERPAGLILREIFDSPTFREAFYTAPAARDHHQNYPGGLLEHTVNVTSLALALADAYAVPGQFGLTFNRECLGLDRQVLAAAGLLHDIGKLQTYVFQPLPEVTELNNWEGHLALGYATVRRVAEPYLLDPAFAGQTDEVHKLLHCILSHHGQLEYGSPVTPSCAEAFILAQADMTDARLAEVTAAAAEARTRDPKMRWLRNQYHFKSGLFIGGHDGAAPDGDPRKKS